MISERGSLNWMLAIAVIACASFLNAGTRSDGYQTQTTGPPKQDQASGHVICFERTGGYAGVHDQFWIYPDGRVVNQAGKTQHIQPKTVEALRRRIEALDVEAAKKISASKQPCSDCFIYRITIPHSSGVKSFVLQETLMDSSENLPKVARELCELLFNLPWSGRNF